MKEKTWFKFPVLFSLYIAQSIPMSFFSTVIPVIMRQEKYSLESIGLLQLVKLPWIFKFLWAPLIDNNARTSGRLRSMIVISEIFYALVILSIGLFDLQTDFKLIVILMILAFIASATQDIAVDIFAILQLKPSERSLGNSMQSAGSFVGSLFGTGVLLIAYHYFGWTNLLILLAAFVVFAIIPMLLYRKPAEFDADLHKSVSFSDIYRFFAEKGKHKRVLILMFTYSGIIGILTMLKPFLVDLGYNVKQIGFMSGIFGTSVGALSALAGGLIIRKAGRKLSMYIFLLTGLMAASWFWFISLSVPSVYALYAGIGLLWGSYGLLSVAIYTTSMDIVRKGREGTDFTIQIVITHLSSLIIAVMSGKVGDLVGYTGLFGIEIMLCLITMGILVYSLPKDYKNEDI
ncbi:MAG: MFS transporter [Bacteroidetes bacterium GWF2_41_9]|nr:MAG: MFS transporter [Bacteroidetes bacterium GWA2_40_15]OFX93751.1 MAG: MFS transporter [Bacteroidetes bacterium GWC2_40_22]OFY59046.1 MAG: MFS transporter [Bacteroidetes bacterium GWF2_41_9]HAM09005.1 MFS transporter [Bacteroidales bacterium]HBQ83677.1 MFS transporter [Bacteroidales bacterium]